MNAAWQFGLCLTAALALPSPAAGEVTQASPSGFVVRQKAEVKAGPDAVWEALVHPARWWDKAHSWSGSASNLTLDPRAGGCFCEALPDGGSAEHMRVLQAVPGSLLRLEGALGPLQSEALAGVLTIELKPAEGATTIEWTYVVGGYARFQIESIAPAVDGVMAAQSTRLASLIEHGAPEPLSGQ